MKNIVIFASGAGSNAENIIKYFFDNQEIDVVAVFTNNKKAGVIEKANQLEVPVFVFSNEQFLNGELCVKVRTLNPSLIVLAGFLLKIPRDFVHAFPNKIVNIHPALLPKYGGKGMYGMHVHEAVLQNREDESGITIHFVDEHFDNGDIIFQATTDVSTCSSALEIALKVQTLEKTHFPQVIEQLL